MRPYPLAQDLLGLGSDWALLRIADAATPTYIRHRAEETVLYQVVSEQLESFLQHARDTYQHGLRAMSKRNFAHI